ncbi:MAG TPA: hypothetical protein VJ846_11400 [Sphingomicrobium sp.]|nr:hypothetical protein [Sphingomicrobium sp.]
MTAKSPEFPDDKTAPERRKNLTKEEIKELELAGGVEGGMQAGSAGGPGSNDENKAGKNEPAPDAKRG